MSGPDVLEAQLRSALESIDQPDPPSGALAATRHAARRRIRRRRVTAAAAALVIAAPVTGAVLALGTDGSERVTTVVDDADQTPPTTEAPLARLSHAWLIDEPLSPIELTEVIRDETGVMSVSVSEEGYLHTRYHPAGSEGFASSLGDAETSSALRLLGSGSVTSEADDLAGVPDAMMSITGVTRAEIAYLELTTTNGSWTIPTVTHPAFPQLRFFAATGDFGPLDPPHPLTPGGWSLVGFASDGERLIDWAEITEWDNLPLSTVGVDGIPADLPAAFLDQLDQLTPARSPEVLVPTWLPDGLIGMRAEATPDGYQLRFESPDGQRAVSISAPGGRPGFAHVEVEGLSIMDRLKIKRGLAGFER